MAAASPKQLMSQELWEHGQNPPMPSTLQHVRIHVCIAFVFGLWAYCDQLLHASTASTSLP